MRVLFQGIGGLYHYYIVLPAYIELLNRDIRIDVFAPSLREISSALHFSLKRLRTNVNRMVLTVLTSSSLSQELAPMIRSAGIYLLKALGYDIIHLNEPFIESAKVITSKFSHTPQILTFHDSKIVNYRKKKVDTLTSITRKARIVTTPSDWLRKILYERTESDSVVIPHCVDPILFNPLLPKSATRKSLGIDIAKKVVVWNGRLDPDKNPQTMFNVIDILAREQDVSFILKCRANYYNRVFTEKALKRFKRLEKSLGDRIKVIYGRIPLDKMQFLYRAADAYITTSPLESFSFATVEAMGCGLPVVVPMSSALPEVVGDAGLYCELSDAECFAESILRILNDEKLAKSLTLKSLDRVRNNYSPMKIAKLYSDLYESAIRRG